MQENDLINLKSRPVYCSRCDITVESTDPEPRCEKCGHRMITLIEPRTAKGSLD